MRSFRKFLFLSLFTAVGSLAEAEGLPCSAPLPVANAGSILPLVEKRYHEVTDLSAEFVQQSMSVTLEQQQKSRGRVAFLRPGKMDWHYAEPEEQRFVTDGKTLWFYQPDLNQVTESPFENSFRSDLPVSFLLGLGSLSKDFHLRAGCENKDSLLLTLVPRKADSSMSEFQLLVRASDYLPIGATVRDVAGEETTIRFVKVRTNEGLEDKQFVFKVPSGVDVIRQESSVKDAVMGAIQEQNLIGK